MEFLVDAQLPPALAHYLTAIGHEAEHVLKLGLERAPDRTIWEFATANGAAIVTKDGDFAAMRASRETGPAIIWVRLGNTTKQPLLDSVASAWPAILNALNAGETVIEIT